MTAPNEFPPLNGEVISTSHILSTPEVPPRPDSLVYADGAIYASKDPSDVEGHKNQDALLRLEGKNLYGVFGGVEDSDGAACTASKAIEGYYSSKSMPKSTREAYVHMSDALFIARESVYRDGPEKKTTGTIVQAYEDEASGKSFVTVGHVGDTRAYVLRVKDRRLEQLTEDQGAFFEEGPTRGGDDGSSRYSLSNAIGGQDPRGRFRPGRRDQIFSLPVEKGDRILICTDGITGANVLTDDEIATAIATGTPRDAAINTAILALNKDGQREADDKSAFVLEIGSEETVVAPPPPPETNVKSRVRTAPHLGRVGTSTTVKHAVLPPPRPTLRPNVPQPERRVVKGFPDSQGGKASYIANTLDGVLDRIHHHRPGNAGQLIENLIDAARTEESQIGYAANGTKLRDELVDRAAKLVAAHDRQLHANPNAFNSTLYDLGVMLRSFKGLNKDLVSPADWEKATSFYRDRGGDALEKHQINMFDKFLDQVEALDRDPSLKTQKEVQEITQLVTDFTDALTANAPWDGVKAIGGRPRGDLASQRVLAIMNGNKGAMLQGNKANVTLTTDQMGLVTYLADRFKRVSDPGPKKPRNKDYIHVSGPGRAREMLAAELLDFEGIRQVLGQSIDPTTTRIGPYAAQHDIGGFRPEKNRREFREKVYQEQVLPRARLLGMDRDTLIALLKDDEGTQSLMDLISNAANGPLKNKILVQRPPTP